MAVIQDVRFGIRQLRSSPAFAATAVLTLALAVGVTTAVFSVLYAVLIRPLPYDSPERIVQLQGYSPQGYTQPMSYPEYRDVRQGTQSMTAVAGYSRTSVNFEGPSGPVPLTSVSTTDNFFDVFGVNPVVGRTFAKGEEQDGSNDVAVLSYEVWQQNFGGARDAVGQVVKLDGRPHTIVGVMPAGFRYPLSARNAIYRPLHIPAKLRESRGSHWLPTIGRIKPGATLQQAQADMDRVMADIVRANPDIQGRRMKVNDLTSFVVGPTEGPLKVLLLAVLAVLAIGCVNIAGLLLARGVKREREIALRSAIGANRSRLIQQMLTEAVLLSIVGAFTGVLVASLLLQAIRTLLIAALSRGADVHINWPVLVASIFIAVATTLFAGVFPAVRLSGVSPQLAMKNGGSAGASKAQHRLRAAFIATQVALALVLLVTSGMLMRSLSRLRSTDLGFDAASLLTTEVDLSQDTYKNKDMRTSFYEPMLANVEAIPGVQAAAVISFLPIQNWGWNSDTHIVGKPPAAKGQEQLAEQRFVSTDYYKTMGIELVRGRLLDPALDTASAEPVAVVNEAFVKKFFSPGEDPVGQYIDYTPKVRIVGVTKNIRQALEQPPLAEVDYSIAQLPADDASEILPSMALIVRTTLPPQSLASSVRQAFHDVDAGLPMRETATMQDVVSDVLLFNRLKNWMFGTFAALAVLLSLVGMYGLISHEIELSTRDIGVRLALGASRVTVLTGVYRRVLAILAIGVACGLALTLAAQKVLQTVVQTQSGRDAAVTSLMAAGIVLAGLAAAFAPARRAAGVEPMNALRYE